jgi:hypothetical protein
MPIPRVQRLFAEQVFNRQSTLRTCCILAMLNRTSILTDKNQNGVCVLRSDTPERLRPICPERRSVSHEGVEPVWASAVDPFGFDVYPNVRLEGKFIDKNIPAFHPKHALHRFTTHAELLLVSQCVNWIEL